MINKTILQAMTKELNRHNIYYIVGDVIGLMHQMDGWYKGNVKDFHFYEAKVLDKIEQFEVKTLNLPKKMCEDWASYIWNEKSSIKIDNDNLNAKLEEVFDDNNFYLNLGKFIEEVEAFGGGALIGFTSNDKVKINFITADEMFITRFSNNKVEGIITMTEIMNGEDIYYHITAHDYVDGFYKIEHFLFKTNSKKVSASSDFDLILSQNDIVDYTYSEDRMSYSKVIESPIQFFQYFSTATNNNRDRKSPYGLSRFGNAIDDIKVADLIFDAIDRETKNGESVMFFDSSVATEEIRGKVNSETGLPSMDIVSVFDYRNPNFKLVKGLVQENADSTSYDPIKLYSPQLRHDILERSLEEAINRAGFKFGFGNNYYKQLGGMTTAQQVIHSKSELWRNIVRAQNDYGAKLKQFTMGIMSLIGFNEIGVYANKLDLLKLITVNFDDSIIIDDEALKEEALQLIDRNILPKYLYLVKFMGMTEKEAKALVKEAEEEANDRMGLAFNDSLDYNEDTPKGESEELEEKKDEN